MMLEYYLIELLEISIRYFSFSDSKSLRCYSSICLLHKSEKQNLTGYEYSLSSVVRRENSAEQLSRYSELYACIPRKCEKIVFTFYQS